MSYAEAAYWFMLFFFTVYGAYRAGADVSNWLTRRRSKREHYDKLFRKEG